MTGNETNNGDKKMTTAHRTMSDATTWGEGILRQIAELTKALKACKAGRNIEDDPSELKAEIARLKRLLD